MTAAGYTGHVDRFVRDHLPPSEVQPELILDCPEYRLPTRLNAVSALLDRHIAAGHGARPCLIGTRETWTYAELVDRVDRIARVLVEELGMVPGNRVLLRAANSPMMAACWLAVVKAGGVIVVTSPMLRARELVAMADKARIGLALCADCAIDELEKARLRTPMLGRIVGFEELTALMARSRPGFPAAATAADDPCLIAFTSGTTGEPKAAVHFHRDVVAVTRGLPPYVGATAADVFCGSPALSFVYGLGGLLLFPLALGASSILIEKPTPEAIVEASRRHGATIYFGVPTSYRRLAEGMGRLNFPKMRLCISAGEVLPRTLFETWKEITGLELLDTIGSTEMLHTFLASPPRAPRPGASGKALPGYQAMVVDEAFRPRPPGEVGRLVVRGPVGCFYLDDPRQATYVQKGWNVTGDAYSVDEDGYFWYQGRTDDLIVTAGYNVAGQEIEEVLLEDPRVRECAVVGAPDPIRGTVPKAFIVLDDRVEPSPDLVEELKDWVKERIAPYKYPRCIEFLPALPRTETGKLQRYKLRQMEAERAAQGD